MIDYILNLNPIIQALLATLFTYSITALGASIVFFFKKVNKTFMDGTLGFAAGIMIAASFFSLLLPAINMCEQLNIKEWIVLLCGFIGGGLLIFIGDKVYNIFSKNNNKRVILLISSITLHNIPEGMAIGVAFGSVIYGIDGASLVAAWTLSLGIGLQNFPEGTAISMPLRRDGYSLKKAFFLGQLSGLVEPISGIIGALLVMKVRILLPILLSFAAGAMIYVVVQELIPESQTNKNKSLMALFTLIGFSLMMVLDITLG